MKIQEWGEEAFIQFLQKDFPPAAPLFGIGDDCAVLPAGESVGLATTDVLVEGVHFKRDEISPNDLGYKTVAVNVSDIAAMGGTPLYALLSLALPRDIEKRWLQELMQGIKEACHKWNVQLIGGDTVESKRDIFLNLALSGSCKADRVKYRHGAQPGDLICVNNYLGDSGGGLKALQEKIPRDERVDSLIRAHFRPNPSPKEGEWLASYSKVHAMMDLSDGLVCDLGRLCNASGCGASLEISQLPISSALAAVCSRNRWDAVQLALIGGEDYGLLFTLPPALFNSIGPQFQAEFGHPLYKIGEIVSEPSGIAYLSDGKPIQLPLQPFHHWKSNL